MSTADLISAFREDDLTGDPWGTAMSWWFSVAGELHFNRNVECPSHWEHRAGMGPDEDSWPFETIKNESTEDLVRFGNILCRFAGIMERQGRSY